MIVRRAREEDKEWLWETMLEFSRWWQMGEMLDEDTVRELIDTVVDGHIALIAEDEKTGARAGVLGAMVTPHPFNRHKRMSQELVWWVAPEYRGTTAGAKLFVTYTNLAKRMADYVVISRMVESPIGPEVFTKRGYRLADSNYILET